LQAVNALAAGDEELVWPEGWPPLELIDTASWQGIRSVKVLEPGLEYPRKALTPPEVASGTPKTTRTCLGLRHLAYQNGIAS